MLTRISEELAEEMHMEIYVLHDELRFGGMPEKPGPQHNVATVLLHTGVDLWVELIDARAKGSQVRYTKIAKELGEIEKKLMSLTKDSSIALEEMDIYHAIGIVAKADELITAPDALIKASGHLPGGHAM